MQQQHDENTKAGHVVDLELYLGHISGKAALFGSVRAS